MGTAALIIGLLSALGLSIFAAAVFGLPVVGYWIFDRPRYRGSQRADAQFQPTGEIFVDPTSGVRQRVYINQQTGERQYRDEPGPR